MENSSSSSPGVFNFTTLLEMLCSQVLVSPAPSTMSPIVAARGRASANLLVNHLLGSLNILVYRLTSTTDSPDTRRT